MHIKPFHIKIKRWTGMCSSMKRFLLDESGATAIEYGLIAALVSVAGVTALNNVGNSLSAMFSTVSSELDAAVTP